MSKLSPYIKTGLLGLAGIGLFEFSTYYLAPEWIRRYSTCYKDAMQSLRQHPEAVKLLGEPIKEGRINLSNHEENNADSYLTWYTVPVEGPKSSGKMRYWINYDEKSSGKTFGVVRIELECNDLKNKILLVKNVPV